MPDQLIEELRNAGIITAIRERSDHLWWIGDGSRRFLAFHKTSVELWLDLRPLVNARLASIPTEQATAETIAVMVTTNA